MSANMETSIAAYADHPKRGDGALAKFLREPLVHFVVLGTVVFFAAQLTNSSVQQHRIVLDADLAAKLADTYARQYGSPPTAKDLQQILDQYVHEEILYREGMALRLDQDDEIIRRRIVQKYEFLQQDLNIVTEPSAATLRQYFEQHRNAYLVPAKVSFSHIYFSPDQGGEAAAKRRAERTLHSLEGKPSINRAPELGDRFVDLYDYASLGADELARLFGASDLVQGTLTAPVGKWVGPLRSGFGWHLVYVVAHEEPHALDFDASLERLKFDYLRAAREKKNSEAFAKLAGKYQIVRRGVGDAGN